MTEQKNPLPKADLNSQLQRKSIARFQAFLPVDRFVFRDERVDDAGVDGSLEILIDGNYTNMRAQVQLKSQHLKKARQDGVITLPIETSNFNYLLNGSLGLYILYIEETNELFYEWAEEENRRRIEKDSEWENQDNISIPLQSLNISALDNIYDRISRKARLYRDISDSLARAPSNDKISVSINPETLESENSVEIEKILSSAGITLVATGYANIVIEKIKLISQKASTEARFRLINAYAHYSTGRFSIALGFVGEAIISSDLEAEDMNFAERLHLLCKLSLGLINYDEYFREADARVSRDVLLSAVAKFQKLADEFKLQKFGHKKTLAEIEKLKNLIITSNRSSCSLSLSTKVRYLEVVAYDSIREVFAVIFQPGIVRDSYTIALDAQPYNLETILQKLTNWSQEADNLIQDSISVNHPIITADAILAKSLVLLNVLASKIYLVESAGEYEDLYCIQNDTLLILNLIDKALKIYKRANILDDEIKASLIMAHVFESIAERAIVKANYSGYEYLVQTAQNILDGNTIFSRNIDNRPEILKSIENDLSILDTEDGIVRYANLIMETFKIPSEHIENVIVGILCDRDMKEEKRQWCHHIELDASLRRSASPDTIYAENPNRRIRCLKFSYVVDNSSPDWIVQLEEFKKMYCCDCSYQEPGEEKRE
jgi:Domain of unknown function (DUF4365)